MDFTTFIKNIKETTGVSRKFLLHDILSILKKNEFNKSRVYKDIGEDSAAIEMDDRYLLLTTDMISSEFIKKDPFAAGYSSILVGIDDIYASGGTPLTATLNVQAGTKEGLIKMVSGAKKAAEHFKISITRGHTSLKQTSDAIACSVVGEIKKENYISAGAAKPGDVLVIIWDKDGKRSPNGPYWNTVSFKTSDEVVKRRSTMQDLARDHLIHASKDISDAGLIGTAYMLINYSQVGCTIDVQRLMDVFSVDKLSSLEWWITAYLTTSFLVTMDVASLPRGRKICNQNSMEMQEIGIIEKGSEFRLKLENESAMLFDWVQNPIFP
mgnify:FL=1